MNPFIKLTNSLKLKKSYLDGNENLNFASGSSVLKRHCSMCPFPLDDEEGDVCKYCLAIYGGN